MSASNTPVSNPSEQPPPPPYTEEPGPGESEYEKRVEFLVPVRIRRYFFVSF